MKKNIKSGMMGIVWLMTFSLSGFALAGVGELKNLPDYDLIREVTFIEVSPSLLSRVALNEHSLGEIGCRYSSNSSADLEKLFQILNSQDLRRENDSASLSEPRQALYITEKNSEKVKILLGKKYIGKSSIEGSINGELINASMSLPEVLHTWALNAGLKQENSSCH